MVVVIFIHVGGNAVIYLHMETRGVHALGDTGGAENTTAASAHARMYPARFQITLVSNQHLLHLEVGVLHINNKETRRHMPCKLSITLRNNLLKNASLPQAGQLGGKGPQTCLIWSIQLDTWSYECESVTSYTQRMPCKPGGYNIRK